MQVVHPFPPVFNENSEILILGSFPSVISREKQFYYANKNNRFWKIMELVFEDEVKEYTDFCYQHHIALWDVIHSCSIKGSSDASISNVVVNDIESLLNQTKIHTIILTGKKALSLYEKYIHLNIKYIGLPSTSSANARMQIEDIVESYRVIVEEIHEKS